MKKNSSISLASPRHPRRNSKSGALYKLCKSFKSNFEISDDPRYGLPPMAPHNTTQDLIDLHPTVLCDVEELMGSCSRNFD
jgi:hypothetical protein